MGRRRSPGLSHVTTPRRAGSGQPDTAALDRANARAADPQEPQPPWAATPALSDFETAARLQTPCSYAAAGAGTATPRHRRGRKAASMRSPSPLPQAPASSTPPTPPFTFRLALSLAVTAVAVLLIFFQQRQRGASSQAASLLGWPWSGVTHYWQSWVSPSPQTPPAPYVKPRQGLVAVASMLSEHATSQLMSRGIDALDPAELEASGAAVMRDVLSPAMVATLRNATRDLLRWRRRRRPAPSAVGGACCHGGRCVQSVGAQHIHDPRLEAFAQRGPAAILAAKALQQLRGGGGGGYRAQMLGEILVECPASCEIAGAGAAQGIEPAGGGGGGGGGGGCSSLMGPPPFPLRSALEALGHHHECTAAASTGGGYCHRDANTVSVWFALGGGGGGGGGAAAALLTSSPTQRKIVQHCLGPGDAALVRLPGDNDDGPASSADAPTSSAEGAGTTGSCLTDSGRHQAATTDPAPPPPFYFYGLVLAVAELAQQGVAAAAAHGQPAATTTPWLEPAQPLPHKWFLEQNYSHPALSEP
eukprot:COSAG01_NODE_5666_length_4112_cov_2.211562_2_plen_532_part_00